MRQNSRSPQTQTQKKSTKSLDAIERIWSEWPETEAANAQDWTKFNQATSGETQPKQMEENQNN